MSGQVRRRSAPALMSVLVCAVLLASGAALAAKPKKNAHFTGHTSATPVSGFHAPVTFTVAGNSGALANFTYGSFGCFGAGGFKPGVNPYTGSSLVKVGRLVVTGNGKVSGHASVVHSAAGETTTTTITVAAKFSTPKQVSGTITYSQVLTGAFHSTCGPAKVTFTASAH